MPTAAEYRRIEQGPQSPQERIWWDKYSHDKLQQWRQVCDDTADVCTAQIKRGRPSDMLDEVIRRAKTEGGVFQAFLDECHHVPGWVDFDELDKGRRVFRRYAPMQGLVLMCSSLIEGYAHNKPSQVLVSTGRLQRDVAKRIYETGQLLHNMVGSEGIKPGSQGHRTLMEVRLIHSAVRQFLWSNGKWDTDKYDEPINQEDLAGTILEFDFMVARGIRKLGVNVSEEEMSAMHYYWRYAGYVLGVSEELLTTTPEEQEVLALQLTSHLYEPTSEGESLAKALLRDMSGQPPFNLSEDTLLAFSELLVGPVLARDFHIEPTMGSRAKVRLICEVLKVTSAGRKFVPDMFQKLVERNNHKFRRQSIENALGDPDSYAFRGLA
ncbi:hypothetical protein A9Q99_22000 [Gammaproteobacteria bacterium 45_16_T64]|nr:hypothetical protein A9Q99_22000 [Gammaproteobacteria bacterium 45_16_T64]